MNARKGMVTLTLLLLLSSFLMITMWFNQEELHFYRAMNAQQKFYVQNDAVLLPISRQNLNQECEKLPLDYRHSVYRLEFKNTLKNHRTSDSSSHFAWCERVSLFQRMPSRGINAGEFSHYFDPAITPLFARFLSQGNIGNYPLYWFSEQEKHWEINGNIYAVVVAEGDLILSGKGELRGAVITQGQVYQGENVKLVYNKQTLQDVVQAYRFWRLAKRSWYDFESL
ncbi:DUF2572 family protein [Avibacterium sp. 21-599]|uniref:DUF2572 family protein n=1 Tax=Avibacterium sp. 21-599 TaxID=2911528 RepID=UPI002247CEAF|nr:DUF2572 family protein [Avibacterium sp. 21-599]MCW9717202.1 DUF2572 family protein [Avibacterium sp. 21-599]